MRILLWIAVAAGLGLSSPPGFAQSTQFQQNFVNSCSKGMTDAPQKLPQDLATTICRCTLKRIMSSMASRLVLKTVQDTHDFSPFVPDVQVCVQQELPKYMQTHPAFLENYIRAHPELSNQRQRR